jgi:hypothetical protein
MVLGLHKFSLFVEKHATSGAGWVDWHRERLWYLAIPFGSLSMMAMLHARCPEAVPKPGNSKWRWSPWRPSEFIPIRSRTFSCRSELFKQFALRTYALCRQWWWRTSATSRTGRLHARQLPAPKCILLPKEITCPSVWPFPKNAEIAAPCSVTLSTDQTYIDSGWEPCLLRRRNVFCVAPFEKRTAMCTARNRGADKLHLDPSWST